MMEQFEKFNEVLDRLEAILTEMKNDNEAAAKPRERRAQGRNRGQGPRNPPAPGRRGEGRRRREGREGRDSNTLDSLLGRMGRPAAPERDSRGVARPR